MKHKTLLVYVPCLDGGCEDVGRIELDRHTLISDERLWDLEAAESEAIEQSRLNGMGGEREAALMTKIDRLRRALMAMTNGYKSVPYAQWSPEMHFAAEVLEETK